MREPCRDLGATLAGLYELSPGRLEKPESNARRDRSKLLYLGIVDGVPNGSLSHVFFCSDGVGAGW